MAIARDAGSNSGSNVNATSFAWQHIVGSGASLLVGVAAHNNPTRTVSSVVWDAAGVNESLSFVAGVSQTDDPIGLRVELWRLNSPTAKTADITVTLSGQATRSGGVALSLTGCDTTTLIDASNTGSGTTETTLSTSVTVNTTGAWLFDIITRSGAGNDDLVIDGGQSSEARFDLTSSRDMGASRKENVSSGSQSMTWTTSSANEQWCHVVVAVKPGSTTQTITPSAIASAEAFGTTTLELFLLPTGISTAEALGSPQLNLILFPAALASGEAFGTTLLELFLLPSGISSAEAFGTTTLVLYLLPSGIATAEAFGSPRLDLIIFPAALASAEAFGTTTLVLYLLPSAISTAEAFGSPTVKEVQTVQVSAIASAEALGSPRLDLIIFPADVATAEAFGTAVLIQEQFLSPSGIASAEALGSPSLALYLAPSSIASAEALGSPRLDLVIFPAGLASGELFGAVVLSGGLAIIFTDVALSDALSYIVTPSDAGSYLVAPSDAGSYLVTVSDEN